MATQPPVDEEPFTAEQAAVAAVNEAFYQAVEDGDLDTVRAVWIDGEHAGTAHCVHPGQPAVHGRSQVLMSWAVVMSRLSYLQFFITDVRVVVCGDMAVVTCAENVLTDLPHGEGEDPVGFAGGRAEATNLFRRAGDGRWLLFAHHSSPVFPSGGAEPPDEHE
ncbi:nuclear transport factor 2 family protein [Actinocrinis puniceicyclus]|uniref:Nuclear transport factor 2 family protein n=1 Tax=Actinocrinis puniceicyclus TaxID=977794 RepID=A0A8J8BEZ8_9ACTN|nr:nuclear transport factor 2 family protein [Actinocrinis puniceicyclus]MBS2966115.1 nuclear transport factor 2 family protein [Actinocrinis puniceicyclus]